VSSAQESLFNHKKVCSFDFGLYVSVGLKSVQRFRADSVPNGMHFSVSETVIVFVVSN
jgi:hypothetical protein